MGSPGGCGLRPDREEALVSDPRGVPFVVRRY
jgi:hypothetical protein